MAEFKRGRMSCQDKHRGGRTNEVTATELKKTHKIVSDDRRLKVRELADMMAFQEVLYIAF